MIIIAHRGGNRVFPENSVAAIRHAFESGVDMAEIDVRLSRDGVPVVIHDDDLLRLFSLNRKVREISAEELTSLTYGHPNEVRPATFESVLRHCPPLPLLIHVKETSERIFPICEVVETCRWSANVVWGVVSLDAVRLLREKVPAASVLAFIPSAEDIAPFASAGVNVVRLWDSWITQERIDLIHSYGILAAAMTGSSEDVGETSRERLLELRDLSMDWVLLNDVQLALGTLRPRASGKPPVSRKPLP
jgi:glycerophosphoryl diester phosphodiesterase